MDEVALGAAITALAWLVLSVGYWKFARDFIAKPAVYGQKWLIWPVCKIGFSSAILALFGAGIVARTDLEFDPLQAFFIYFFAIGLCAFSNLQHWRRHFDQDWLREHPEDRLPKRDP